MKIEVQKEDLINLLGKTQNIVEKRNTMAVLTNILLEAKSDGKDSYLRIYATDLEVSLTDFCKVKIEQEGSVAVNGKNLFEIIKELSQGPIKLTKKDNNWLEIKQGKYLSKIVGINSEEYPVFPSQGYTGFVKINSEILKEMIDKTIYSVSNDETRYYLNGVYFVKNGNATYNMVATDGHRLSMVNKELSEIQNVNVDQGVIIPRKGLNEIKKILESSTGFFELTIEGSQLILKYETTTLMIRLIEGKYPNYQQFIPKKLKEKVIIDRELFLGCLKRVSLLSNYKSKVVTISLANNRMEIASNNPELGDAKEEIDVEYSGADLRIGFNAKYITDVLNSIADNKVDFEINDQLSPGIIRPHNDQAYTCVVMPMRI